MKNINKKLTVLTVIVSVFMVPLFAFAAPDENEGVKRTEFGTEQKENIQGAKGQDLSTVLVEDNKSGAHGDKNNAVKERNEKIDSANKSGEATLPPLPPAEKPADMFTEKGMGENLLLVSLGVGIFTLVVALITLISVKSINGYMKTSINKRINDLSSRVSELERKLNDEIEKNARLAGAYEQKFESVQKEISPKVSSILTKSEINVYAADEPALKQDDSTSLSENFLNDYHNLMKLKGIAFRSAKEDFIKKYSVKSFACKNIDARLQNSSVPPIYEETTDGGKFWGFFEKGQYMVAPALPFNYDNIAHGPGAMGDAFTSNFQSGSFEKLEVITPAVFTERFKLIKKGEIRLIA